MTAERPAAPPKPILDIEGIQKLLPHRAPLAHRQRAE